MKSLKFLLTLGCILIALQARAAQSFNYIGASYNYHTLVSNNEIWNKFSASTPSFTLGRRFHPLYSAELSYSSYTYTEGASDTVDDIVDSQFDISQLRLGVRFFGKNISFSLGYSYVDVQRQLTLREGSNLNKDFYDYDRVLHGVYGTIGYQVFILGSIDLYTEIEASSNEQYHSIGASVGFRFYPCGLLK